jgi:Family of unknown function (DUF6880)
MHEAVALLRQAAAETPAGLLPVLEKAIAAAVRVVLRADDSSGIIGDAIRDLLALHADLARRTPPAASKLVTWLVKFQFDGTQDFFHIDISDYAPALGDKGLALYRAELAEIEAGWARTWSDLADAYEKVNPVAVLPVLRRLALGSLRGADARSYQYAARLLQRMRRIAAGTDHAAEVDALIGSLREEHRRRPRLRREFDAASSHRTVHTWMSGVGPGTEPRLPTWSGEVHA